MSLNYNLSKIRDRQDLHSTDLQWVITEMLIWATMHLGMPTITKSNVPVFAERLHVYQDIFGGLMPKAGVRVRITTADVQRRVGLSTNASTLTAPGFKNKCWDRVARNAATMVRLDLKALELTLEVPA